jgi:hypothetical protein
LLSPHVQSPQESNSALFDRAAAAALLDALEAATAAARAQKQSARAAASCPGTFRLLYYNLGLMLAKMTDDHMDAVTEMFTRPGVLAALLQVDDFLELRQEPGRLNFDPFAFVFYTANWIANRGQRADYRPRVPAGPGDGPELWVEILAEVLPARLAAWPPRGSITAKTIARWPPSALGAAEAVAWFYGADLLLARPSIVAAVVPLICGASAAEHDNETWLGASRLVVALLDECTDFQSGLAALGGSALVDSLVGVGVVTRAAAGSRHGGSCGGRTPLAGVCFMRQDVGGGGRQDPNLQGVPRLPFLQRRVPEGRLEEPDGPQGGLQGGAGGEGGGAGGEGGGAWQQRRLKWGGGRGAAVALTSSRNTSRQQSTTHRV